MDIGKAITDSATFLAGVYRESGNLSNLLKQQISAALLDPELKGLFRSAGPWIGAFEEDPTRCMYYSLGASLPLKRKGKRITDRALFFQISLAGEGMAAVGCSEPLLHIGLWDEPISFTNDYYMGFPLFSEDEVAPEIDGEVLMRWQGSPPAGLWLYSLRLAAVNTPDDIRRKVVEPVRALLAGRPVEVALPTSMVGVVRYRALAQDDGNYSISFSGDPVNPVLESV